jgi:branched-chain amino acid aminotransferase
LGAELARRQGYTQVLWLDAVELRNIEEVGTMNIYVRFNDEVVTPKLTGGILPGITRMSVLEILKDWGYPVVERPLSLDEFIDRHKAGEVLDVFGTGTASVISSVAELKYKDAVLTINDGHIGELARNLFDELTGFHYGLLPDRFGWLTNVEAAIPAV